MEKRLVELQETAVGDIVETGVKLSNLENQLKTIEMTMEIREKKKEIMKGIDMRMERKNLEEEVEESLRSKLEVSAEVVRAREIEGGKVI